MNLKFCTLYGQADALIVYTVKKFLHICVTMTLYLSLRIKKKYHLAFKVRVGYIVDSVWEKNNILDYVTERD